MKEKCFKKLSLFFYLTFLIFCSDSIIAQTYFVNDSTNNFKNAKLENYIRGLVNAKLLVFDNESYNSSLDVLDSKEKAEIFAKQIAMFKFPECKEAINKFDCEIIEDKTSKMWFVKVRLAEMGFDNIITLLVLKNNCKVILLANTF